jgi:NADH-quinone oxidoreductase subunit L
LWFLYRDCLFLWVISSNSEGIHISLFDWIKISNFKVNLDFIRPPFYMFCDWIGSLICTPSAMHAWWRICMFFAYLNLFIFFAITLVLEVTY